MVNQNKILCPGKVRGTYSLILPKEREFILKKIKNGKIEDLEDYLFKKYREYDVKDMFDYLNMDYLLLLDFKNKEVLDIGSGEGSSSIFFAKYGAKKVYSLEMNPDRLEMLKTNADKMKLASKIVPINTDFTKCKIKKDSFDIVTFIGVLEWLPKTNAYSKQLFYLKKVKSALKEKGKLLVAIENRLSPFYFIGKTHHDDIPFSPLMPRFLANLVSLIVKGKPYVTYTYTDKGYLKLFKKAGFKNIKIYPIFPAYQEPRFVIDDINLYRNSLRKYGVGKFMSFGATVLSFLPNFILRKLVPAYVVIGEK
jgi:SAM-dependent methyltransferase